METLRQAKVLVLANAACLSDCEIECIREYVRQGGRILATGQTSLYLPDGTPRPDFALQDVFGGSFTGAVKNNDHYGYQRVRGKHALTAGLEETSMLASWGPQYLTRQTSPAAETPIAYLPQIFPQPPERSWLRDYDTDYPTVLINRYGSGQSIFFPYDVDRNVWRHGHQDFSLLLKNALDYLLGEERTVRTNAPWSVHFSLKRSESQPGSYILHAVNTTSAPRRPVLQTVSVRDIEAEITLPGQNLIDFRVIYGNHAEIKGSERLADGRLRIRVRIPEIGEYLGVRLDMDDTITASS